MEILNLDELVSEDKKIQFMGREFIIPGDITGETMLRLMDNSSKMEKDPACPVLQRAAYTILEDILRVKNADIEEGFLIKNLNTNQYVKLISFIYSNKEEKEVKKQEDESSEKPQTIRQEK